MEVAILHSASITLWDFFLGSSEVIALGGGRKGRMLVGSHLTSFGLTTKSAASEFYLLLWENCYRVSKHWVMLLGCSWFRTFGWVFFFPLKVCKDVVPKLWCTSEASLWFASERITVPWEVHSRTNQTVCTVCIEVYKNKWENVDEVAISVNISSKFLIIFKYSLQKSVGSSVGAEWDVTASHIF